MTLDRHAPEPSLHTLAEEIARHLALLGPHDDPKVLTFTVSSSGRPDMVRLRAQHGKGVEIVATKGRLVIQGTWPDFVFTAVDLLDLRLRNASDVLDLDQPVIQTLLDVSFDEPAERIARALLPALITYRSQFDECAAIAKAIEIQGQNICKVAARLARSSGLTPPPRTRSDELTYAPETNALHLRGGPHAPAFVGTVYPHDDDVTMELYCRSVDDAVQVLKTLWALELTQAQPMRAVEPETPQPDPPAPPVTPPVTQRPKQRPKR